MEKNTIRALLAGGFLLFAIPTLQAQDKGTNALHAVESHELEITDTKTTNVIFPFGIVSVDRGSKDILVQKAKGVDYILQVKAASDSIVESNLSVVTTDGKLTTFVVRYVENPSTLNVSLGPISHQKITKASQPDQLGEDELQQKAQLVLKAKSARPGLKASNNNIDLHLKGIFIQDGVLYFRMRLANWSNIRYDIEQFRFFIRDKKVMKRTATQEIEIIPVYISRDFDKLDGKTVVNVVFALPKFTIPDQKYLAVQVMEKNGGRHVGLKVVSRHVLGAQVIK